MTKIVMEREKQRRRHLSVKKLPHKKVTTIQLELLLKTLCLRRFQKKNLKKLTLLLKLLKKDVLRQWWLVNHQWKRLLLKTLVSRRKLESLWRKSLFPMMHLL